MANMEFLSKLFLECCCKALRTPWITQLTSPSWSEDASLFSVNKIYFRAALKLFVLFYSESREHPLGTVKYALAHFSWAHVYISAWKSPLSLLRIYIAKVAISQVPCKVIMVDVTSGIMYILKGCRIWACAILDQCRALGRSNCCCACVHVFLGFCCCPVEADFQPSKMPFSFHTRDVFCYLWL